MTSHRNSALSSLQYGLCFIVSLSKVEVEFLMFYRQILRLESLNSGFLQILNFQPCQCCTRHHYARALKAATIMKAWVKILTHVPHNIAVFAFSMSDFTKPNYHEPV